MVLSFTTIVARYNLLGLYLDSCTVPLPIVPSIVIASMVASLHRVAIHCRVLKIIGCLDNNLKCIFLFLC